MPYPAPILALVLAVALSTPVQGQEDSSAGSSEFGEWPQWSVSLGVTWLDADGRFSVVIPGKDPITVLDFDRVGLSRTDTSHYLSAAWRSRQSRWGAWFANWRFDATGTRIWTDELPIDPETLIPVGASVISDFDAEFYVAEVTYSLFRDERIDAGIGLGFHIVDLETNLLARIRVGDDGAEVIRGELDTLAPLPNLIGYAAWRILPRWAFSGRLGWFGLSIDKYSGDMLTAHAMVEYKLSDRWMLGGGYQFISFDVNVDRTDEEGYTEVYDVDFAGPALYLTLKF